MERGRYIRPIEYKMQSSARNVPKHMYRAGRASVDDDGDDGDDNTV